MADSISTAQLRRLQTLYSRVSKSIIDGNTREARLAWATQFCERPVASFSDLTRDEAHNAINTLQASAGQPQTIPARRKRLTRDDAQRAGTDGRKDKKFAQHPQMAGASDRLIASLSAISKTSMASSMGIMQASSLATGQRGAAFL